jgi:outer membrane lipoprotein SlyB
MLQRKRMDTIFQFVALLMCATLSGCVDIDSVSVDVSTGDQGNLC